MSQFVRIWLKAPVRDMFRLRTGSSNINRFLTVVFLLSGLAQHFAICADRLEAPAARLNSVLAPGLIVLVRIRLRLSLAFYQSSCLQISLQRHGRTARRHHIRA